ncbi:MAG: PHP domain-containing protein [Candidatus Lokiarchaeota archaeon]|nr:PHP domain-containing protein [Candidatus Lokiarchaeota archaeon]
MLNLLIFNIKGVLVVIDLHSHSFYSDGGVSISEACSIAKNKKLECLAITDHYTTSWKSNIINHLTIQNIDKYIQEIKYNKNKYNYPLLKGIEIDTQSRFEIIYGIQFNFFDIILLEYVSSIETLEKYINLIHNHLNKFNTNKFPIIALAHPNIHLHLSQKRFKNEFIPFLPK